MSIGKRKQHVAHITSTQMQIAWLIPTARQIAVSGAENAVTSVGPTGITISSRNAITARAIANSRTLASRIIALSIILTLIQKITRIYYLNLSAT